MSRRELEQIEYQWRVCPAQQRPWHGLIGLAIIALLAWAAASLGQSPWWALLAAGFLLLMLNRFYLPSQFAIGEQGIVAQYPLTRIFLRWDDVRRFACDDRGGILSTRVRPSIVDGLKGVHMIFDGNREQVAVLLHKYLPPKLLSPDQSQKIAHMQGKDEPRVMLKEVPHEA